MYKDKVVLCGASAYEQKYYFNQDFSATKRVPSGSVPFFVQQRLPAYSLAQLFVESISSFHRTCRAILSVLKHS